MDEKKKIYFVGAGGIGMSALERYFLSQGYEVGGYDRTPSDLTRELEAEGVDMTYDDSAEAIPERFRDPKETLVVYTPAVPADHPGFCFFKENGFEILKRAAVLGMITRASKALCFSGTHGKTTTSSMAAHILHNLPMGCNAFLGGVLRNYGTNFLLAARSPYSVVEADEYDRSFHQLTPYVAVVTATDPDHLDIYGTEEAYVESFAHFTELIRPDGCLIQHTGLKLVPRVAPGVKIYTYSRDEGDFHATNIRRGGGEITFDFVTPDGVVSDIALGVPVEINIENAIAAMSVVWAIGKFDADSVRESMKSYQGAKRRFEFWLKEDVEAGGHVVIDDYAHHPDELLQSIRSVRALYPGRHLTVAFQPHLYTRTRDFAPEFARALSEADRVILADLYPAREKPIPGISSKTIFDAVTASDKMLINKEDLPKIIKNTNFEILLTAGAGDMCNWLPELVEGIS